MIIGDGKDLRIQGEAFVGSRSLLLPVLLDGGEGRHRLGVWGVQVNGVFGEQVSKHRCPWTAPRLLIAPDPSAELVVIHIWRP